MARREHALVAFNRGIVSKRAQARVDVPRVAMSADQQTNWRPETLGPMALRVGMGYLLNSGVNYPDYMPFVFAEDDVALIEMTDGEVKIVVDDAYLTLPAVAAAVTNGDMEPDLTGWTDASDAGATAAFDGDAGALVALSDQTVYDIGNNENATAKYKLDADGSAYTQRLKLDSGVYTEVVGEWLLSGAAADYEHRATVLEGSVDGSATGSWLGGGTDREWTESQTVLPGTVTARIRVETKLVADSAILASAIITLKATRNGSGGGGGGFEP